MIAVPPLLSRTGPGTMRSSAASFSETDMLLLELAGAYCGLVKL